MRIWGTEKGNRRLLGIERGLDPHNHHPIEQMATVPAAEPTHAPAVNMVAYRGQFSEAQELRFELHMLSHMHDSGWGKQSTELVVIPYGLEP